MIKRLYHKILGIIFPNKCLACNQIIDCDSLFCNDDWQKLQFITEPKCKICSQPFISDFEAQFSLGASVEDGTTQKPFLLCAKCLQNKPSYDSSITIFAYNDAIKKVIGDLKYRDGTNLSKKFGKMLWQKIAPQAQNYNLIIAVPLHKKRLRERKFNQSILLAKAILQNAKIYKNSLKFYPDILLRTKYTKAQARLGQKMRQQNLHDAFLVNQKYLDKIKGSSILLIDDVITTGTTAQSCATILKKAGAIRVTVATIAHTTIDRSRQSKSNM